MATKLRACTAFALLITAALTTRAAQAQLPPTDPKTERLAAINYAKQQNWLAALPIFEDLYSQNPRDIFVLEGLAQSLIARAVTLTDSRAAGKDRLRARDLLLSAKELGDQSQLSQNLLDVLKPLSASGEIKYADNGAVDAAMKSGEAAFARHEFDEAIKNYSHALELDPKSYHAALFVGDSYFAEKRFPEAGEWYDRAKKINPNIETAYRYHADMLTKQGDFAAARIQAIEALVAEPYNAIPWRGLAAWGTAAHVQLQRVHVQTGAAVSAAGKENVTITFNADQPPEIAAVWLGYSAERALWSQDKFKKAYPQETQYRHSLAEESNALTAAAKVAEETGAKSPNGVIANDANVQLLLRLYHAGLLDPYILLNGADQGIAQDYAAYREKNRDKVREYLGTFVVPEPPKTQ
jgi:tetratricopeptide (TPR) repeat protein